MKATKSTVLQKRLNELFELQKQIAELPYSIPHRLQLANAYRRLGYPDLAVGDAYKALILVDEIVDEGEYHDEALETAQTDVSSDANIGPVIHRNGEHDDCCCRSPPTEGEEVDEESAIAWAKTCWSRTAYGILVPCLVDCGCLRSAFDYSNRALKAFPDIPSFKSQQKTILHRLCSHFNDRGENFETIEILDYPDKGLVRRELYPWNEYEPDRFSPMVLSFLNDEMSKAAPKLEVKVSELPLLSPAQKNGVSVNGSGQPHVKQLGIFAKEEIPPGEQIFKEKSPLTAISRLHETYCDACVALLPKADVNAPTIACEDCDEVFFCSQECHDLAQEKYHPSLCGVSAVHQVPASEIPDALYTLLLVRALALAETQDLHPLELKEVHYIWGDYSGLELSTAFHPDADAFASLPRTLPFSFNANILTPLNILEKMDVNIFTQSHRYDTWVFNTLYAKFRGTASARQGLDGKPEISAVHPMWSLANHSCDPNVAWEWQGSMRFWTRDKLVDWEGRVGKGDIEPGIRKGEELLSHYCDIRLPVKERREWAVGALGGLCVCARCVWEDAEEKRRDGDVQ